MKVVSFVGAMVMRLVGMMFLTSLMGAYVALKQPTFETVLEKVESIQLK